MRPGLGAGVDRYVFEPRTADACHRLADDVRRALVLGEPRVLVDAVEAVPAGDADDQVLRDHRLPDRPAPAAGQSRRARSTSAASRDHAARYRPGADPEVDRRGRAGRGGPAGAVRRERGARHLRTPTPPGTTCCSAPTRRATCSRSRSSPTGRCCARSRPSYAEVDRHAAGLPARAHTAWLEEILGIPRLPVRPDRVVAHVTVEPKLAPAVVPPDTLLRGGKDARASGSAATAPSTR